MARDTGHTVHLGPRLMLQLAAPHTWTASIFPVLLGVCVAQVQLAGQARALDPVMVCVLLAIAVLMQSAVNTLNDYFDYVKGTDTADNQPDPTDAVLVYHDVDPRQVKRFAVCLIACAFVLGLYCVAKAGVAPLLIALVGVVVIYLYSGGSTPLSYLPVGEVVSGFAMGGLICLASHCCLVGSLDWPVLAWAVPVMLGIALTMMTNNGCDIEKDTDAGRKTLPVMLGRARTVKAYHGVIYAWTASICVIVFVWFSRGWVVLPFMLLAVHPVARALIANPLNAQTRAQAFSQCASLNMALGTFYCLAVLASSFPQ